MSASFQFSNKFNEFIMEEDTIKPLEEQLTQDNEQSNSFECVQTYEAFLPSFKFLERISSHYPFEVWLCLDQTNRTQVIIKILHKINLSDNQLFHAYYHSMAIQNIQSSKTVQCYKIENTQNFDFFIMEFCCKGDILDFMAQYQEKNIFQIVKKIAFDVANGLRDIHSQGYVHRDIKPQNIGVNHLSNGKILDFGLTIPIGQIDPYFCGTIQYIPPEHLEKSSLSKRIQTSFDCWSFGIFLYQIFHGYLPYNSQSPRDLLDEIYEHSIIFDPQFPQSGKQLIQKLLETNPKKRCTMQEVVQHQFFKIDRERNIDKSHELLQKLQKALCSCSYQKNFVESQ